MRFHANFLDVECLPDLAVAFARNYEREDLTLPLRKPLVAPILESAAHWLRQKDTSLLNLSQCSKNDFVGNPLYQITHSSRLKGLVNVLVPLVGGNYEDPRLGIDLPDCPDYLNAISVRQLEIQQSDLWSDPPE